MDCGMWTIYYEMMCSQLIIYVIKVLDVMQKVGTHLFFLHIFVFFIIFFLPNAIVF